MTRGTGTPLTLSEADGVRYLHFGSPWIQGAMRLADPVALELSYARRMMAWLLFLHAPAEILQLGLGAGALTRWTHARLPRSRTTVVERDAGVVACAQAWFGLPPPGPRMRLVQADAGVFVRRRAERARYGVVQVDLYDMDARGPVLDDEAFYRDVRGTLAPPGIAVVNLFGGHRGHAGSLRRLARAFDGRVMAMAPVPEGNVVALAFAGPPLRADPAALRARARWLQARCGLPATAWLKALPPGPLAV